MTRPRITTVEDLIRWIVSDAPWTGCTCADCRGLMRETVREVEAFAARKQASR